MSVTHYNYRVFKSGPDNDPSYEIRDVFYKDGKPESWIGGPSIVRGGSPDQLRDVLRRMLLCLDKAILKEALEEVDAQNS